MATATEKKILEIEVKYDAAVQRLAQYKAALEEAKTKEKQLADERKKGIITDEQYNKQLSALEQHVKNVKAQQQSLTREVQNNIKAEQTMNGSLAQLRAELSNATKAYDNLSRAERNAAKGKDMLKHINEITKELKEAEMESQRFYRNVGNYPSAFSKFGGILGTIGGMTLGIGSLAAAGTMLVGKLKEGVTTAMDFESATSTLAAILGTAKDQMSELTEQARKLGATTRYTATEVTELQTELAKLGYNQAEIQDMTQYVLNFAQATGSSLADAASLAGAALRMFGDDTSHTQEYVDKMAASCTNSAISFNYLQNALSTVGPVANSFGFNIEDVLALLGQLANAGFDASSAATATRNILLNLADANGDLAKALGEPVKDLPALLSGLQKLKSAGVDLNTTLELTDKRSVAAFNTFLDTADGAAALQKTLQGANGAAAEMAATKADNLQGDLASLGSAWDDFMISLNNGQGILRALVQGLTNFIRKASEVYAKLKTYLADLYNQSSGFRAIIQGLGYSFKNVFGALEIVLKNMGAQLKAFGQLLHGVFTLDMGEIQTAIVNMAKANARAIGGLFDNVVKHGKAAFEEIKNGSIAVDKATGGKSKGNATGGSTSTTSNNDSGTGTGGGIETKADRQRKEKAAREAEKAARENLKRKEVEAKAIADLEKSITDLMGHTLDARRKQINDKYDKEIADLRLKLSDKKHLTAEAEDAITKTIVNKEKMRSAELAKISDQAIKERLEHELEVLNSDLAVAQSNTYESYNIKKSKEVTENDKRQKDLDISEKAELIGVEAGSAEALAIQERYARLRENSVKQMWQNIIAINRDQQEQLNKNEVLALQNQLTNLEIAGEQQVKLRKSIDSLGLDVVTQNEMDQLEKQKEISALKLQHITEAGKLENETEEEFNERRLAAQKELAAKTAAVDNAEIQNKQAVAQSMRSMADGMISVLDALGEENENFAKMSKVITLALIAIDTGKALAEGISASAGLPYPANLAAIASTVGTVLANIATAISTVKSAKFATGAVNIRGAGTGTSDSIPAMISNGESVINAKATQMFPELLTVMNAIGNGVALPRNNMVVTSSRDNQYQGMTDSFRQAAQEIKPVVSVQEISRVSNRVKAIETLGTL